MQDVDRDAVVIVMPTRTAVVVLHRVEVGLFLNKATVRGHMVAVAVAISSVKVMAVTTPVAAIITVVEQHTEWLLTIAGEISLLIKE